MTITRVILQAQIMAALDTVTDPELDQPITELGFVQSVSIEDANVTVHLRLPTAFCAPNFAYLMASDTQDVLRAVDGVGEVRVLLHDHHDSDKINTGLALNAGYVGTFGSETLDSLEELRTTFLQKAHTAAMERCVSALLRQEALHPNEIHRLTLHELPEDPKKAALLRLRCALGLSACPNARVVVDDDGHPLAPESVPMRLRFARSVRISLEGNSHFCRGLLATRYDDDSTATTQFTKTRTGKAQ